MCISLVMEEWMGDLYESKVKLIRSDVQNDSLLCLTILLWLFALSLVLH